MFNVFNRKVYDSMDKSRIQGAYLSLSEDIQSQTNKIVAQEDGYKIKPFVLPGYVPYQVYLRMQRYAAAIVNIQFKILQVLLTKMDRSDLLLFLGIDPSLADLMDWKAVQQSKPPIGRFDILLTRDGTVKFCELNLDSSVGGGDVFSYVEHFRKNHTDLVPFPCHFRSFYQSLAEYLVHEATRHNKNEITIFDWSSWVEAGYFNYSYLQDHIAAMDFESSVKTEKQIFDSAFKADHRLFYRTFLHEDVGLQSEELKSFLNTHPAMVTSFESELYCAKIWFGLFHEESYQQFLTQEERRIIAECIPYTKIVTEDNVQKLLANKDDLIFKPNSGHGGAGIVVGRESTASAIESAIFQNSTEKWIAQTMLEESILDMPVNSELEMQPYHVVLGLYKAGDTYSGILLRASQSNRIVNVSNGDAFVGWLLPVETE